MKARTWERKKGGEEARLFGEWDLDLVGWTHQTLTSLEGRTQRWIEHGRKLN